MQSLVLNITGKTNRGLDDTIASTWYHNGHQLFSSYSLGPLKQSRLKISQSLTLENSSIYDAGTYSALLTIDPRTHFISHLGCHNNYYTFVASTVGADDAVLVQANLQLKYYGVFISVALSYSYSSIKAIICTGVLFLCVCLRVFLNSYPLRRVAGNLSIAH